MSQSPNQDLTCDVGTALAVTQSPVMAFIKHSKLLPYFFRGSYLFNMVFLNTSNFVTTPSSECVEGMAMPRFTATQKPRAMHPARTKIYKTTFKIFVLVHYMLIQFLWKKKTPSSSEQSPLADQRTAGTTWRRPFAQWSVPLARSRIRGPCP